jgi:hypothetical protein
MFGFALSPFIATNVLQLPEPGDLEALHGQPITNFERSTVPDLITSAPIAPSAGVRLAKVPK